MASIAPTKAPGRDYIQVQVTDRSGVVKTLRYRQEESPVRNFVPENLSKCEQEMYRICTGHPLGLYRRHDLWASMGRRFWFTYALDTRNPAEDRAVAWFVAVQMAEPEHMLSMRGKPDVAQETGDLIDAYFPREDCGLDDDNFWQGRIYHRYYRSRPVTLAFSLPSTPQQAWQEAAANAGAVILEYPSVEGEALWRLIRINAEASTGTRDKDKKYEKTHVSLSSFHDDSSVGETGGETFGQYHAGVLGRGTAIVGEETLRMWRTPEDHMERLSLADYEQQLDDECGSLRLSKTETAILQWHRRVPCEMIAEGLSAIPPQSMGDKSKANIRDEMRWRLTETERAQKSRLVIKLPPHSLIRRLLERVS